MMVNPSVCIIIFSYVGVRYHQTHPILPSWCLLHRWLVCMSHASAMYINVVLRDSGSCQGQKSAENGSLCSACSQFTPQCSTQKALGPTYPPRAPAAFRRVPVVCWPRGSSVELGSLQRVVLRSLLWGGAPAAQCSCASHGKVCQVPPQLGKHPCGCVILKPWLFTWDLP